MRIFALLLFLWPATCLCADGPSRWMRGHHGDSDGPWLGVNLTWVEKGTVAQLKDVPEGFGLLVEGVEPQSPASTAGLQPLDVVWKFDDQFVANKWQLYALMKMVGVGGEAKLTVARAGDTVILPIVIGTRPDNQNEIVKAANEVLMPPIPGDVVRYWDRGSRSGFIADGDVTVSLRSTVEGYQYMVSENGEVTSKGMLSGTDEESWPSSIDQGTRRKLQALFQSLLNAEVREEQSQPVPRVRRVPIPKNEAGK